MQAKSHSLAKSIPLIILLILGICSLCCAVELTPLHKNATKKIDEPGKDRKSSVASLVKQNAAKSEALQTSLFCNATGNESYILNA